MCIVCVCIGAGVCVFVRSMCVCLCVCVCADTSLFCFSKDKVLHCSAYQCPVVPELEVPCLQGDLVHGGNRGRARLYINAYIIYIL